MRVGAIIQARMSSTRCPNKVLHPVAGKPLLGHLLHRLNTVPSLDVVAVATSNQQSDDRIAEYCVAKKVPCFRGELDNVAGRLLNAANHLKLDAFVRICGDSPILDPCLVDDSVSLFRKHTPDFVTNCLPKKFPAGQSVEVISLKAFVKAYKAYSTAGQFEHVTTYFYENPDAFDIRTMHTTQDYSGIKLAVDTPEDLRRVCVLLEQTDRDAILSLDELAARYRSILSTECGDCLC